MLVGPISSSLFTLAFKRNRVRVGYELFGTVRSYSSELIASQLLTRSLVAPIISHIPPTRFILGPPVGGTEKPLFLLRALPQKNSDFAVLIADAINLEPVAWCQPGTRALARFQRPVYELLRANGLFSCQQNPHARSYEHCFS